MLLFVLYKMKDKSEYSALSQLAYVMDNEESFLNLCEFFGGLTIRVPTIKELKNLIYGLLLYKAVAIDKHNFNDELDKLRINEKLSNKDMDIIKNIYLEILEVTKNYTFGGNLTDG